MPRSALPAAVAAVALTIKQQRVANFGHGIAGLDGGASAVRICPEESRADVRSSDLSASSCANQNRKQDSADSPSA